MCPNHMQEDYAPMVDNALLSDMSMSAVDFVPHQAELNGTGARRLNRYVEIMKIYGGTLHYDGVDDEKLTSARMKQIEDYLVDAGLDRGDFTVERGLAGDTGFRGIEALSARSGNTIVPLPVGGTDARWGPPVGAIQTGGEARR